MLPKVKWLVGSSSSSSFRNGKVDKKKVLREVQDNIKRIPCEIPQQVTRMCPVSSQAAASEENFVQNNIKFII